MGPIGSKGPNAFCCCFRPTDDAVDKSALNVENIMEATKRDYMNTHKLVLFGIQSCFVLFFFYSIIISFPFDFFLFFGSFFGACCSFFKGPSESGKSTLIKQLTNLHGKNGLGSPTYVFRYFRLQLVLFFSFLF